MVAALKEIGAVVTQGPDHSGPKKVIPVGHVLFAMALNFLISYIFF